MISNLIRQYRLAIAALSFVMMCGETEVGGVEGLLIQTVWSAFWAVLLIKSTGVVWKETR